MVHGDNAKSELQTTVGDNLGDSGATVVQNKQRGRAESQLLRNEGEVQEVRRANAETGKLFLCDARCPITNRFCRKEFLSKEALCRHQSCREHDFPQGFSTETKMAMLISQPGGILAGSNLPDCLSKLSSIDCLNCKPMHQVLLLRDVLASLIVPKRRRPTSSRRCCN